MQHKKKYKTTLIQNPEKSPFIVELTLDANCSFYDSLLEAVDQSFLTLGGPVKASIYFYLENSMGITKQEIPFRIDDFQNALEKIFGAGTRLLEILFIKKLHEIIKIEYKADLPLWMVPDITFREYIRLAKIAYESAHPPPAQIQPKFMEKDLCHQKSSLCLALGRSDKENGRNIHKHDTPRHPAPTKNAEFKQKKRKLNRQKTETHEPGKV